MKWRAMDVEAKVIPDLAFVCVVLLVAFSISTWLALGLMIGGYVTVRVFYADTARQMREQRHRLRLALWLAGDRRR